MYNEYKDYFEWLHLYIPPQADQKWIWLFYEAFPGNKKTRYTTFQNAFLWLLIMAKCCIKTLSWRKVTLFYLELHIGQSIDQEVSASATMTADDRK